MLGRGPSAQSRAQRDSAGLPIPMQVAKLEDDILNAVPLQNLSYMHHIPSSPSTEFPLQVCIQLLMISMARRRDTALSAISRASTVSRWEPFTLLLVSREWRKGNYHKYHYYYSSFPY